NSLANLVDQLARVARERRRLLGVDELALALWTDQDLQERGVHGFILLSHREPESPIGIAAKRFSATLEAPLSRGPGRPWPPRILRSSRALPTPEAGCSPLPGRSGFPSGTHAPRR